MTEFNSIHTRRVLEEVLLERRRQHDKWGEQNWPIIHESPLTRHARRDYDADANRYKELNDMRVADDMLSWDGILLEEVYEALAEGDPEYIRAELVQVAAVACAMIESLDRHAERG